MSDWRIMPFELEYGRTLAEPEVRSREIPNKSPCAVMKPIQHPCMTEQHEP